MGNMAEALTRQMPHNVILEGRKRLHLSGVTDVERFDEESVVLCCETGEICIRGEGLQINRVDLETGEFNLEGERIDGITYLDQLPNRGGFWSKLFK